MKTITTIDFDIIMGSSIEGYNDLINPPKVTMSTLCKNFPYYNNALPDFYIYEYLTRYVTEMAKKVEKDEDIIFISTHDQMYDVCKNEEAPFDLINIDHHHDINYHDNWNSKIIQINSGNWVKRLFDMNKINEYIWISNPNSLMFDKENCPFADKIKVNTLQDFDLGGLAGVTDKLILCYSPEYLPDSSKALFLTWRAIVEEVRDTDYLIT